MALDIIKPKWLKDNDNNDSTRNAATCRQLGLGLTAPSFFGSSSISKVADLVAMINMILTVDSFAIAPPERLLRRWTMRRTTGAIANEINSKWVFLKIVDLTKEQNVTVPYSVFMSCFIPFGV